LLELPVQRNKDRVFRNKGALILELFYTIEIRRHLLFTVPSRTHGKRVSHS